MENGDENEEAKFAAVERPPSANTTTSGKFQISNDIEFNSQCAKKKRRF